MALECISDVYDGESYRTLSASKGPLKEVKAISFTFNTDGVVLSFSESEVLACSVNDQRTSIQ